MCSAPVCHFPTFDVISVGSCDLHALDTPPAFILSQDQTLSRTSGPKTGHLILYRRCNHTEDNFFVITGFYFWLDSVVNDQRGRILYEPRNPVKGGTVGELGMKKDVDLLGKDWTF